MVKPSLSYLDIIRAVRDEPKEEGGDEEFPVGKNP